MYFSNQCCLNPSLPLFRLAHLLLTQLDVMVEKAMARGQWWMEMDGEGQERKNHDLEYIIKITSIHIELMQHRAEVLKTSKRDYHKEPLFYKKTWGLQ